jgi:DNA-binding transcriptional ArsR family regulator
MKRQIFEELSSLNRLIHDPSRLAILTALAACRGADFLFLQSLTGLTKGNLSGHLGKLEKGGMIAIMKSFKGKYPHTDVALTPEGRDAIRRHWKQLDQLRRAAGKWSPAPQVKPA